MKTKKIYLLAIFSLCLLFVQPLTAQKAKVKVKKGQATINDVPYCLTDCSGLLATDCKIKNLDGEILVSLVLHRVTIADKEEGVYELFFANTDYTAQVAPSFSFTANLLREFDEYKVIVDNQLNEEGVQSFVRVNSKDLLGELKARAGISAAAAQKNTSGNESADNYPLVERDRTDDVSVLAGSIKQNFKAIGKYDHKTSTEGGKVMQRFKIYLPSGTQIAEVTMDKFGTAGTCKVVTLKDNKQHTVKTANNLDDSIVKSVAEYLVSLYYL